MLELLVAFGFITVFLGYTTTKILPSFPYLYAQARVSARSRTFLTKADYDRMLSANDFKEFLASLRETPYSECIDVKNARGFHLMLEKRYLQEIANISEKTPAAFKKLIDAYLAKYQAKTLKIIMKSKMKGIEIESSLIYPIGDMDETILKKLLEAETVPDMAVIMSRTRFAPLFSRNFWDGKSWEEIELEIDSFVSTMLNQSIKETKIFPKRPMAEILKERAMIDCFLLLIRAKLRGIDETKLEGIIRTMGFPEMLDLVPLEIEDMEKPCERFPFGSVLMKKKELLRSEGIKQLELELERYFNKRIREMEVMNQEGAFPIFAYFIKRRAEKRRLQVISKGIEIGLQRKEIEEMMI